MSYSRVVVIFGVPERNLFRVGDAAIPVLVLFVADVHLFLVRHRRARSREHERALRPRRRRCHIWVVVVAILEIEHFEKLHRLRIAQRLQRLRWPRGFVRRVRGRSHDKVGRHRSSPSLRQSPLHKLALGGRVDRPRCPHRRQRPRLLRQRHRRVSRLHNCEPLRVVLKPLLRPFRGRRHVQNLQKVAPRKALVEREKARAVPPLVRHHRRKLDVQMRCEPVLRLKLMQQSLPWRAAQGVGLHFLPEKLFAP
mmetsp:Transcript_3334/g.11973  ORF Transcript_3334/g.11973 Transcript_3334/m.11973 type:complete len:252 (+) Transcript_3334:773-1528(+)